MMAGISTLGFVSALLHSHVYWIYSIIYIAYHKLSPINRSLQKIPTKKPIHHIPPPPTVAIPTIVPTQALPTPVIRRRKMHRRSSTGQLFKKRLSTLIEVDARSLTKADMIPLTDSGKSEDAHENAVKKDRGFGIFRSKFPKSYSTNDIHSLTEPRRRKRDALLVIFSGRSSPKEETIKKRSKLFSSLPSWKKVKLVNNSS